MKRHEACHRRCKCTLHHAAASPFIVLHAHHGRLRPFPVLQPLPYHLKQESRELDLLPFVRSPPRRSVPVAFYTPASEHSSVFVLYDVEPISRISLLWELLQKRNTSIVPDLTKWIVWMRKKNREEKNGSIQFRGILIGRRFNFSRMNRIRCFFMNDERKVMLKSTFTE